jgi:hypothetical protein
MKGIYETTLKSFQKDYLIRDNQFYFPLKNKDNSVVGYEIYEHNSLNFNLPEDVSKDVKQGIWHTHFHPDRAKTQKVFIFNRAIDALSYYQIYRPKIDFSTSAFVSLGNGVGKETLETLQALYPQSLSVKYYSAFGDDFNGLIYNLALEKRINPKFDFQLGRVGECFECVINGKAHSLDWAGLNFETLFSELSIKPQLRLLHPKTGHNFHQMLLQLQANSKGCGRLVSVRAKL